MKYFFSIWFLLLLFAQNVFSQETITHKVERGETITEIAKKYQVTPYDIYKLNPDAKDKLKPRTVLLIPSKSTVGNIVNSGGITHKVLPKETLFGIEKKYNVSDADLKKANLFLEKDGLQIGQVLVIPSKNAVKSAEKLIYHDVQPKETKYSIAKQYGITIAELEKKNPEIVSNLPIGYHLLIKGNPVKDKEITSNNAFTNSPYKNYEIKPKETLYSLSKMAGMTQEELLALNPELKNGVEIGMNIKMPSDTAFSSVSDTKVYDDLTPKTNFSGRKKIALLLPFNISRVQGDTVNSVAARLKKR